MELYVFATSRWRRGPGQKDPAKFKWLWIAIMIAIAVLIIQ